jgi:formylglycine-generating enzyme required for sulfatase activity
LSSKERKSLLGPLSLDRAGTWTFDARRYLRSSRNEHAALPREWRRLPVTAVRETHERRYLDWLRASGRVPTARLCTEYEWERAARGADGRTYPHGEQLRPGDANFFASHSRATPVPSPVGHFPVSASVFGVFDLVGNVWEWTTSSLEESERIVRGGSYYFDEYTARCANRTRVPTGEEADFIGLRVCADAQRQP